MSIDDALSARSLALGSSPLVSPAGQWVAYTLTDPRRKKTLGERRYVFFTNTGVPTIRIACDVWIIGTRGRESKSLTGGEGSNWGPVWSPNGDYLAFYSDRGGQAQVWIWDKATGRICRVSDTPVRLYFPGQLVQWTPDSRKILVRALAEGVPYDPDPHPFAVGQRPAGSGSGRSTVVLYQSPVVDSSDTALSYQDLMGREEYTDLLCSDLALIDVANGDVQRLARRVKMGGYWVSPDGSRVAYTCLKDRDPLNPVFFLNDLMVATLPAGSARVAATMSTQEWHHWQPVSWSPDSAKLSYVTQGPDSGGVCFVVSATGGKPHNLTEGTHPSFSDELRPPLWDARSQFLYLLGANALWRADVEAAAAVEVASIPDRRLIGITSSPAGQLWSPDDGRSVYLATEDQESKQMGFYQVNPSTGQYTRLLEENRRFGEPMGRTMDGSDSGHGVVYTAQGPQESEEIWIAGVDFTNPRRLTHLNPQFDQYRLGASRLIEWRSLDGQDLRGALLLPADFESGKRYPLIVNVYGGSRGSNNVNTFGLKGSGVRNMQLLATRGYAVLLPDAPLRVGTPMQDLARTVLAGVDRVIELGIADPGRLGVMGHSYGGYSVLSLIVQTTRFRAAVSSGGFGNLISEYVAMRKDGSTYGIENAEEGQIRMGGTPWQFRDRYIENSPVFSLDCVHTPLLLVHGSVDDSVPSSASDEIFVSLRRLGKEVVYAKYEGESHFPGNWGYDNQIDYWERVIEWFDAHLAAPQ